VALVCERTIQTERPPESILGLNKKKFSYELRYQYTDMNTHQILSKHPSFLYFTIMEVCLLLFVWISRHGLCYPLASARLGVGIESTSEMGSLIGQICNGSFIILYVATIQDGYWIDNWIY
jgi:hypothetical protein